MRIEYDQGSDTVYIGIGDAPDEVRNEVLEGPGFMVVLDIGPGGKLAGIELSGASQWVDLAALLPIEMPPAVAKSA